MRKQINIEKPALYGKSRTRLPLKARFLILIFLVAYAPWLLGSSILFLAVSFSIMKKLKSTELAHTTKWHNIVYLILEAAYHSWFSLGVIARLHIAIRLIDVQKTTALYTRSFFYYKTTGPYWIGKSMASVIVAAMRVTIGFEVACRQIGILAVCAISVYLLFICANILKYFWLRFS